MPVPRLYAFKDRVAPYALASVKIGVQGSPNTIWHDAALSQGGVPWMNPCSSESHRYMAALAAELKDLGFELLMVDGCSSPTGNTAPIMGPPIWRISPGPRC